MMITIHTYYKNSRIASCSVGFCLTPNIIAPSEHMDYILHSAQCQQGWIQPARQIMVYLWYTMVYHTMVHRARVQNFVITDVLLQFTFRNLCMSVQPISKFSIHTSKTPMHETESLTSKNKYSLKKSSIALHALYKWMGRRKCFLSFRPIELKFGAVLEGRSEYVTHPW